ncbi:glycosyltransferase [Rhodoferax sp.]|uniref:glycosyltransferase n=1 Tax=Rhodoferax sp. TaxID=50421 RepID=UPI00261CC680|nr:glycosyltransferase [Rhodoferax sp.]MDD2919838.1 glycosyltransferase [Rhodoferax sp.]
MALRILHIGKFFPPYRGGMESFLADLVLTQREQGIDSHALVHGDPLPQDPTWLCRVPVQLNLIYTPIALGFRAALKHAIRRLKPQVLHLHMPNVSAFWALTLMGAHKIPWVVHWHSDVVVSSEHLALRLAYTLYRPFEQAVLERAERIIVTSLPYLYASEPLQHWQHKCVVVPLGIRPELPAPDDAALPWQSGRLRLLSLGRLAHYKGFDTLIRAVSGVPGLQLVIAGQGENMASLQDMVQAGTPSGGQPNVQLIGEVSEARKHQLLASCDAFCLASCERTEAFGVVLLEAMAHAKPCIVSDLPGSGMSWLVSSSGAGLCHLPVGDVKAWRQALQALADQPGQLARWGADGQRALHERFSMTGCSNALATEYFVSQNESRPETSQDAILVVIPARDEAATIGAVVSSLLQTGWKHVLVVDDHSGDGTGALARQAGASVTRPLLPLGAWGGMQMGIRYAHAHGYRAVITMDADGQHEVAEIPVLVAGAEQADVVIGAHTERASRLRRLAWRWFRLLGGIHLHDLTSGFRYYNRRAIATLAASEATLLDYQDIGVIIILQKAGLRITEVPVNMSLRQVGRSRIFDSWFSVARYMLTTTLICLAHWPMAPKPACPPCSPGEKPA